MDVKAIVFDMDGVLRIGNHPVKYAKEFIEKMQKKNIRGMISTNECRYTEDELRNDLGELGINIPETWPVYTSGMAVRDYLEQRVKKNVDTNYSVGLIGESGLFETLSELTKYSNFEIKDVPPKYETNLILIIGTVNKIKICHLEKGLKWLKSGAKVITTCPDMSDPSSKGDFILGMPNHITHMLNYNTCAKTYSLGKPHPIHAHKIKELFNNVSSDQILFVGDTMYTDIRLAEEHDFKSCLVLTGNAKKDALKNYITEPDIVLESVKELENYI